MEALRSRDLGAMLDVVAEVHAVNDPGQFVEVALHGLHRLVPVDFVSYNEFDAADGHAFAIVDPPEIVFPGAVDVLARNLGENPLIEHFLTTHDRAPRTLSDFLSKRALHRTELYQQLYRPIGGEYLLASSLSASGSTMIGTGLFRTHRDFSPRDRTVIQLFNPHLAAARAKASSRTLLSLLTTLLADEGRAFILLGRDGSIHHTTTQAQKLLHVFFDDAKPADSSSLPHTLRNWLRRHTQNTDTPPKPLRPLIAKRDGKELRITLTTSNNPTMPHLLELEQPAGTPDPATLRNLGLSRRQSQVLALITTGATNNEIARRLDVSPRTVKKHLEHIYNQLGVRTRTAASTIALQTRRQ